MTELTESDARRMVDLTNSRNVDQILEQYAEDATFQNPMLPGPVTGKEAIRSAIAGAYTAFPDWRLDLKSVAVKGNEVFTTYTANGTHQGPLATASGKTIPATQRRVSIDAMSHILIDEKGKIKSLRAYGNPLEVFRQLGIQP
jgi:steroid delta-isomerase-like uncharacterized protein